MSIDKDLIKRAFRIALDMQYHNGLQVQKRTTFLPRDVQSFAPVPYAGYARKPHKPWGYGKSFNYIHKRRSSWYRIYTFLKAN